MARQPVARTVRVAAAGQHLNYSVVLQPALPGENTIVVTPRLLSPTGFLPLGLTADVVRPGKGTPIHVTFTPLEDGRWVTATPLSERGSWRLNLTSNTSPNRDTSSLQLPVG